MIKVYHANNSRDSMFYGHDNIFSAVDAMSAFISGEGYAEAALVDTNDLEAAFELTNHITQSWTVNSEIVRHAEKARSTCVGDIMVTDDNQIFIVASIGFDNLVKKVLEKVAQN